MTSLLDVQLADIRSKLEEKGAYKQATIRNYLSTWRRIQGIFYRTRTLEQLQKPDHIRTVVQYIRSTKVGTFSKSTHLNAFLKCLQALGVDTDAEPAFRPLNDLLKKTKAYGTWVR